MEKPDPPSETKKKKPTAAVVDVEASEDSDTNAIDDEYGHVFMLKAFDRKVLKHIRQKAIRLSRSTLERGMIHTHSQEPIPHLVWDQPSHGSHSLQVE